MRRREFITLVGGAAALAPFARAARAQQQMPVIGFLHSSTPGPSAKRVEGFRKGLAEAGFIEGRNVAIEFRWASGQDDRLPAMAADLIRRGVAVIVTPATTQATLAAHAATKTIPIVFGIGSDPVAMGLVASLNRPGGNLTGISILNVDLMAKRLGLLRELAPQAARFAVLVNPTSRLTPAIVKNLQEGARELGLKVGVLNARSESDIDAAFTTLSQQPGSALLLSPDEFIFSRRAQVIALAARYKIPTIYYSRELVEIAGWPATGLTCRRRSHRLAPMSDASSRARSRLTCRWCNRREWSWCSTSAPPRRSASPSRTARWRSPTRSSNRRARRPSAVMAGLVPAIHVLATK